MRVLLKIPAVLLVIILTASSVKASTAEFPLCPPYTDESLNWAYQNYESVLNELMPMPPPGEFVTAVRIVPSFEREFYFSINKSPDGSFRSYVVAPEQQMLNQLRNQKRDDNDLTIQRFLGTEEVRRWFPSVDAGRLKSMMQKLNGIEIEQPQDVLCLDGTLYEFLVSRGGEVVPLEINCYKGKKPSLIQWADDMRELLLGFTKQDYKMLQAADHGKTEEVIALIQRGANVHAEYDSLAWIAAISNNTRILGEVLKRGFDLKKKGSIIVSAADSASVATVHQLIAAGVDVNSRGGCCSETALMKVASLEKDALSVIHRSESQLIQVAGDLVEAGADLDVADDNGSTPLASAVLRSHSEIADFLIESGAKPNITDHCGNSPLMWAAEDGDVRIVGSLLSAGADVTLRNVRGKSALNLAADNRHTDVVQMLVNAGARFW